MTACPWERIDAFRSYAEFHEFAAWMRGQVQAGVAEELTVGAPYVGATTFQELWFRHRPSGQTWRLVEPAPPFAGIFEPVN